jgi:hypothetical protein
MRRSQREKRRRSVVVRSHKSKESRAALPPLILLGLRDRDHGPDRLKRVRSKDNDDDLFEVGLNEETLVTDARHDLGKGGEPLRGYEQVSNLSGEKRERKTRIDLVDRELVDRVGDVLVRRLKDPRCLVGRAAARERRTRISVERKVKEKGREENSHSLLGERRHLLLRSHVEPDREHPRHRSKNVLGSASESEGIVLDRVLEAG